MFPLSVIASVAGASGSGGQVVIPYLTTISHLAVVTGTEDSIDNVSTSIATPASRQSGDFAIVVFDFIGDTTTGLAPFTGEGWTTFAFQTTQYSAGSSIKCAALYKILTGTEGTYALPSGTTSIFGIAMNVYRGNYPISEVTEYATGFFADRDFGDGEITTPFNSSVSHYFDADFNWQDNTAAVRLAYTLQSAFSNASNNVLIANYSTTWSGTTLTSTQQQTTPQTEGHGWIDWVAPSAAYLTNRRCYLRKFNANNTYRQVWAADSVWAWDRGETMLSNRITARDGGLGFYELYGYPFALTNTQYINDYLASLP